jgi:cyclopropane fatty-acyl-phospholipid synthase-like methyltransferase
MAVRFRDWAARVEDDPRDRFVDVLMRRLEPGARVLELGIGGGAGSSRRLAQRFRLTGVDISGAQLELARTALPQAHLVQADITEVEFEPESFDAVVSLYVLAHVPRELLGALLERVRTWLRPGGAVLVTLGAGDEPGGVQTWLGVPMFFSSHPPEVNRRLISAAGLAIEVDELVTIHEPEGEATFHWMLARAPAGDG